MFAPFSEISIYACLLIPVDRIAIINLNENRFLPPPPFSTVACPRPEVCRRPFRYARAFDRVTRISEKYRFYLNHSLFRLVWHNMIIVSYDPSMLSRRDEAADIKTKKKNGAVGATRDDSEHLRNVVASHAFPGEWYTFVKRKSMIQMCIYVIHIICCR